MTGTFNLGEMRDRLELMLSLPAGSPYVDSVPELNDINQAYELTAYAYDWPSLLTRAGIVNVANLNRYSLPSNYRKLRTVKLNNVILKEVEFEYLDRTRYSYCVDQIQDDIILNPIPNTASTAYTLTNAESAGNAVTIELDTVSGLSQYDEIFVDSAAGTDEFTVVSSVNTSTPSITARLKYAKSASDIIYRANDILDLLYYRRITLLSATGDTTLLPSPLDYIMLHKAAALCYERLEMFDEATRQDAIWKDRMQQLWLSFDKNSTGEATSFSV